MNAHSSSEDSKEDSSGARQRPKVTDAFKDISRYVSKEQWTSMREFQKTPYRSAKNNCSEMLSVGLTAQRSALLHRGRRTSQVPLDDSDDSDTEWMPRWPEPRRRVVERKLYTLRQGNGCAYEEVSEPQDDDFLYCEKCKINFIDSCPTHGPPTFMKDSVADVGLEDRAVHTLPTGLRIGPSSIPGAGLGVWNGNSTLPVDVHFGPYEGQITEDEEAGHSGYAWMISEGRQSYKYVDGKDTSHANWMRYVNCARIEEEQNLVAIQYHGQIFYRTCKAIKPGTELLVWYGNEYGQVLGLTGNSKWKKQHVDGREPKAEIHLCPLRSLAFSIQKFLSGYINHGHLSQIHWVTATSNMLQGEDACPGDLLWEQQQSRPDGRNDGGEGEAQGRPSPEPQRTRESGTSRDTPNPPEGQMGRSGESEGVTEQELSTGQTLPVGVGSSQIASMSSRELEQGLSDTWEASRNELSQAGDSRFACRDCGRGFRYQSLFIRHRRTHTGEKPYVCRDCGRGFTRQSNLTEHKRTHTGEKPYVCSDCGRAFTFQSNLNKHKRTHTGEKPYVCNDCGRCFSLRSRLTSHQRTHTGEKPYVCRDCGRGFSDQSNLTQHKRKHTGEKPYVCRDCGRCFRHRSSLSRHQRTHRIGAQCSQK
ncbi:histone-lysine N-methyltransferase PRDM9 [Octodon degus]|uniref:Histone-lysine N-methyltransferase PRDM9 n=1 Tax=Octodon degus TaxID=10160 RepID=A0A6P6DXF5_OCTDE|nr:histone-lysine N-methyltransferase PRDM9 [Octodon degus]